jgi:N-acetyl-anhydromuramyl-L-alanine amidase AmpD
MPKNNKELKLSHTDFFEKLQAYGYTYSNDKNVLLTEFRRHFLPHLLNVEELTYEDVQSLACISN